MQDIKLKCTLRRWDKWSENCEIPSLKQRMFQLFDDLNIADGDKKSLYQEFLDFDFLPYVNEIHPDCYIVAGVDHKDEMVDPYKIARKFLDIKFRERKQTL